MSLILAIPSKGRLQEQASAYFADCGLPLRQDGGARLYSARIPALPDIEVRMLSASEIARALRAGEVHVGVVGEDGLREADPGLERTILIKPLGFGQADLIVAVPQSWLDVTHMNDLAEVAALHRARTGERLRIATKYLVQSHAFLEAKGVGDYRLVESLGATEGAPAAGAAEAIIDITTTGQTLAANHLRPLVDGLIVKSQAQLAASRTAPWDDAAHGGIARLLDTIEARARAKAQRLLRVAPGPEGPQPMIARAAELGCQLASAAEGALLELYCPAEKVFAVCAALQNLFGGAIGVFEADFLFERPNAAHQALLADLKR
ncbi:MAG TPA: ATP phosphoribosyltransferase [Caulobacterales bacterium]|nr:ATP phosphoribosyltransferase [Caulobacterales bacterium]